MLDFNLIVSSISSNKPSECCNHYKNYQDIWWPNVQMKNYFFCKCKLLNLVNIYWGFNTDINKGVRWFYDIWIWLCCVRLSVIIFKCQ